MSDIKDHKNNKNISRLNKDEKNHISSRRIGYNDSDDESDDNNLEENQHRPKMQDNGAPPPKGCLPSCNNNSDLQKAGGKKSNTNDDMEKKTKGGESDSLNESTTSPVLSNDNKINKNAGDQNNSSGFNTKTSLSNGVTSNDNNDDNNIGKKDSSGKSDSVLLKYSTIAVLLTASSFVSGVFALLTYGVFSGVVTISLSFALTILAVSGAVSLLVVGGLVALTIHEIRDKENSFHETYQENALGQQQLEEPSEEFIHDNFTTAEDKLTQVPSNDKISKNKSTQTSLSSTSEDAKNCNGNISMPVGVSGTNSSSAIYRGNLPPPSTTGTGAPPPPPPPPPQPNWKPLVSSKKVEDPKNIPKNESGSPEKREKLLNEIKEGVKLRKVNKTETPNSKKEEAESNSTSGGKGGGNANTGIDFNEMTEKRKSLKNVSTSSPGNRDRSASPPSATQDSPTIPNMPLTTMKNSPLLNNNISSTCVTQDTWETDRVEDCDQSNSYAPVTNSADNNTKRNSNVKPSIPLKPESFKKNNQNGNATTLGNFGAASSNNKGGAVIADDDDLEKNTSSKSVKELRERFETKQAVSAECLNKQRQPGNR
ncbi:hypothetical protein [Wolbachia endosymbiont of Chironomus riparius]|uniref:hypothetical protein n=1 Tax=Wolbachia endosymbiont of Chironomus riparius TaxID=2883238 RepID=UPI00209CFE21|nr:hypothetical protein [Wolbachia endosymbiont of Chironomus riparius]